ncbi:hypothetical protein OMAG_002961 [Candidatus Omnitrophus magneticus]|uniref:Uncharacterized protein n=1 Tax=Candidatus Omnitrophus magneticus TaxID=1609969 RepID=A0A0F0CIZ5_9BACT|nr:hypothetical protein OMAG_002961 [Candidatus Omnitrophus magneticus]
MDDSPYGKALEIVITHESAVGKYIASFPICDDCGSYTFNSAINSDTPHSFALIDNIVFKFLIRTSIKASKNTF